MHTTNYVNTFIEVAEDCPVQAAEVPPTRGAEPTAANIQFELLHGKPYRHTSDDAMFAVHARKHGITKPDEAAARELYFSKGQACLRSSPLTKRYGWGVHSDAKGRIALVARESKDYAKFAADKGLKHVKAMRSKRA
jgi:hypothetical protein